MQRSIMNLDKETGVSIMKIVEKLDAGPVIHQDKINLNENIYTSILLLLKHDFYDNCNYGFIIGRYAHPNGVGFPEIITL